MSDIYRNLVYKTLRVYEMELLFKAQQESENKNYHKQEIYRAKANAVRKCILLIKEI